ncbi:MAG: family 10 glycosylhydrolase [Lachnospiraceae bacterium]|nr:family 10 glycosylhydrolase [Lachnospiraceae bacterium]
MWIEGNYRRNLLDMHIDDWNPEFLSKIDVDEYVDALADAGVQGIILKARPHTGLSYYPTKVGRMHKGLKGFDFFGTALRKCHEKGIAVEAYFTQIFDNWAYENHPDWRLVTAEGKCMRDYRGLPDFKTGRYGIVCPNNPGYRAYVEACLTEMNTLYDFEGMFLDMTFWPEVCYCESCQKRYREETGKELPRRIDWNDPEWRAYVYRRDEWMAEFAAFSTGCVKKIKPKVTVEHQFSRITGAWIDGSSEMLTEHVDYSGGDYYGGFLQQSFINKYYKNVSPNLPFIYHTSRCDPELVFHTTTKTREELILHVMLSLLHNGAFLLVDAINPDGTIVPDVYHKLMKDIYGETSRYEEYVSGNLHHDAAIWFASHAKYDPNETDIDVMEKTFQPAYYLEAPTAAAKILRENNILFEVIGTKNIASSKAKVMILSHVANIRDEELEEIRRYLEQGGNLYISGPIANEKLQEMLGIKITGKTAHDFTYMEPAPAGASLFEGFDAASPFTVPMQQYEAEITEESGTEVLATLTLPYTMTNTSDFAAIHSNPPGIHTDNPCMILKHIGKSKVLWSAAPIEMSRPYMSKQVFHRIIRFLCGELTLESNAPKAVELLFWEKDGKNYLAAVNEQEEPPITVMYDIEVILPARFKGARLLPDGTELFCKRTADGRLRVFLPKLHIYHVIEVI